MQKSNLPDLSPLQVGVRFQSPVKKRPMEIFGQFYEAGVRMFHVGECALLLTSGYEGYKLSEQELLAKLAGKEIEIEMI